MPGWVRNPRSLFVVQSSMRRPFSRLVALAATVILSSCASTVAVYPPGPRSLPTPSGSIPLRIVSTHGPFNAYLNSLYASPSLATIRSAVAPDPLLTRPGCAASICWPDATYQHGLLYIAAVLWFLCSRPDAISADMTSDTQLRINVSLAGRCPVGAGSAAGAPLCLLDVPLSALPHGLLSISMSFDNQRQATRTVTIRLP